MEGRAGGWVGGRGTKKRVGFLRPYVLDADDIVINREELFHSAGRKACGTNAGGWTRKGFFISVLGVLTDEGFMGRRLIWVAWDHAWRYDIGTWEALCVLS